MLHTILGYLQAYVKENGSSVYIKDALAALGTTVDDAGSRYASYIERLSIDAMVLVHTELRGEFDMLARRYLRGNSTKHIDARTRSVLHELDAYYGEGEQAAVGMYLNIVNGYCVKYVESCLRTNILNDRLMDPDLISRVTTLLPKDPDDPPSGAAMRIMANAACKYLPYKAALTDGDIEAAIEAAMYAE